MNYNDIGLYKVWAPDGSEWVAWAKPALFAGLPLFKESQLDIPESQFKPDFRAMVIVDLPGKRSVEEALAFAAKGYRPVPLYNGVFGEGKKMVVNLRELGEALYGGTVMIANLPLSPGSPPVFMLDSNRMSGSGSPGSYDNRWCVFPQDMPSAAHIKSKGIDKIIVRVVQHIETDLGRVLYDYQKNGIALYALRGNGGVLKELTVKKQSFIAEWAYRFKVILKLKRNATGGFGGKIPDANTSGGSGGHYYRFG